MRTTPILIAALALTPVLGAVTRPASAAGPAKAQSSHQAIGWETSLERAQARAAKTGKPLLVLHMFGKLTEEFC